MTTTALLAEAVYQSRLDYWIAVVKESRSTGSLRDYYVQAQHVAQQRLAKLGDATRITPAMTQACSWCTMPARRCPLYGGRG